MLRTCALWALAAQRAMSYSGITVNDPNPIKRYLQDSRFTTALSLYPASTEGHRVLDFGGGDGELCLRLLDVDPSSEYICYEPSISMHQQAKTRVSAKDKIGLIKSMDSVSENSIDVVYSLEVFEHLPHDESEIALSLIYSVLKPGGCFIAGVPNELFLAAVYKGLFRIVRRFGEFDASLSNIMKCAIGRPPIKRPVSEISPGMNYYFHHLGFDHRQLRKSLEAKFGNSERFFSPFGILGLWGSPEIYYVLHKASNHAS